MDEAARYQRNWNRASETDFLAKLKSAGLIVDEHPDIDSFRTKSSALKEGDLFKDKETRDLLERFLKAAKAGQR